MVYTVKNIISLVKGIWVVSYTYPLPCGCGFERSTITIRQAKRPAESNIQKRIKQKHETKNK